MRARLEAAASETALERDGASARDATLEAQRAELARQLAETRSHLDHSEAAARELREGGSAAAAEVGSLRERLRQAEEQIAAAGREKARARARTLLTFHPLQRRPTRPSVASQERLQQFLSRAHERGAALAREREEAARRLELQSEQLESNAQGQRAVASENAASHATELVAARGAAAREAAAAAEREDALRMQLEAAQACTARERREKDAAQRQLDALNASAVAAAGGGAGERAAVVGGAAELHDARLRAERDATDARAALESVKAELQRAKDEASRERLRADGADAQVEREQIKGRRATALAEAERDVMRERLQHRGEAIDEAMSEVQLAEERVRQEARSVRQHAAQQVERAEKEERARGQPKVGPGRHCRAAGDVISAARAC